MMLLAAGLLLAAALIAGAANFYSTSSATLDDPERADRILITAGAVAYLLIITAAICLVV